MKEITISIEKLFRAISKIKKHKFIENEELNIFDLNIHTLSEKNEKIRVTHLIQKTDSTLKFILESGLETIVAREHIFSIGNDVCVKSDELSVGQEIMTANGLSKIISIEYNKDIKEVFDITVNSENHLYQTANGVIHHNTSFLESISTLTGVPLVIIEAPHITQEHIINIPFLVIDGAKRRTGNVTLDDSTGAMKVVQAESNLVSQLKIHRQKSRDEIEAKINKNPALKAVYESPDVKRRLMGIDGMFNSILFLDEYFRTSSKKIKNVLRNILNGQIGNDKIPEGTYIMMASNVDDEGVDDIPENYDFQMMKYEAPDKEDFFDYIKSKYVNDPDTPEDQVSMTGIEMKPEVFNTFYENLNDKTFGVNDDASGVRLSPRRVEQMLIYVDAMTPCKSEDEVRGLLTFIKTNLTNYLTGDTFNEIPRIMDTVKRIIKETSPEMAGSVDSLAPFEKSDWKKTFANEIKAKLKLGENRKYVPVIAGDPGIGKCLQYDTILRLRVSDEMFEYLSNN